MKVSSSMSGRMTKHAEFNKMLNVEKRDNIYNIHVNFIVIKMCVAFYSGSLSLYVYSYVHGYGYICINILYIHTHLSLMMLIYNPISRLLHQAGNVTKKRPNHVPPPGSASSTHLQGKDKGRDQHDVLFMRILVIYDL